LTIQVKNVLTGSHIPMAIATNFRNLFDLFSAVRTGFTTDDGQVFRGEDHRNGSDKKK